MNFIGFIGEDKWIGDKTPRPMDDNFLLNETGEVLLLEDGSGLLLEEQ